MNRRYEGSKGWRSDRITKTYVCLTSRLSLDVCSKNVDSFSFVFVVPGTLYLMRRVLREQFDIEQVKDFISKMHRSIPSNDMKKERSTLSTYFNDMQSPDFNSEPFIPALTAVPMIEMLAIERLESKSNTECVIHRYGKGNFATNWLKFKINDRIGIHFVQKKIYKEALAMR